MGEICRRNIPIQQTQAGVLSGKFRNRVDHYADDVMETACGLHNFRLTHRQKGAVTQAVAA